jgi:hypothetical protein
MALVVVCNFEVFRAHERTLSETGRGHAIVLNKFCDFKSVLHGLVTTYNIFRGFKSRHSEYLLSDALNSPILTLPTVTSSVYTKSGSETLET